MATAKFLHCADLHIDSPLRGLARHEGAPVGEIRDATRRAFDNLVDLAVEERVGCVVIAGDIYDGDRDDYRTALFLQRRFERLREAGISVALVYGNHDAASEITKRLRPPDNVHVFGTEQPTTHAIEELGLALHGQSYATKAVREDLSAAYPRPEPNLLNVGILHTCLDGRPGHEPYAPCSATSLAAHGYEYWALGHVHERDAIEHDDRWIVFPGNLQGRHARELGPRGATLVTYDGDRVSSVEHRVLDTVRWAHVRTDVTGAASADEATSMVFEEVRAARSDDDRLHALRVTISGATGAHDELWRNRDAWENQLRADALGTSGRTWIEKIELDTSAPVRRHDAEIVGEAIAAVRSTVAAAAADVTVLTELMAELAPLTTKLRGVRDALEALGMPDLTDRETIRSELHAVEALLIARLAGEVV